MATKTINDVVDIPAEAGVIASLLLKPELYFYSEDLQPKNFSDEKNGYLYYALGEIAKMGDQTPVNADSYLIRSVFSQHRSTEHMMNVLTPEVLNDAILTARNIARESKDEYRYLVDRVLDCAYRRNTYAKLRECEQICIDGDQGQIQQKIYSTLDNVLMEFSNGNDIPQYKDVVDKYWEHIKARQSPETSGAIPFKFNTLNAYVQIERGELVIFGAEPKMGKSMIMLNCAADLLKRGFRVLYLDSELNSELFTCRMLSHLTKIPFKLIRGGGYTPEEKKQIDEQREWLKTVPFTHLYMPVFDSKTVYTTVKRVYYQQGIDVLIVDYFKGGDNPDAFATYQSLGGLCDEVKNRICGELNIAGLGAAQANAAGRLADSAKIDRNASTIIMIQNKDQKEIEEDGEECGNKKLFVRFNRNGPQMVDGEYIDMVFDGNRISYEEAPKQHVPQSPY